MELFKKNINTPNFKAIDGVEVDNASRKVSGVFSDFWTIDKAGDMILPKAFDISIRDRGVDSGAKDKILFHWMHDITKPIGKITSLTTDENNARFEAQISKIVQGDEALEQYADGTLNQHSFGYYYTRKCDVMLLKDIIEEYPEFPADKKAKAIEQVGLEGKVFVCPELKLIEISVVSYGCNSETEFTGFKSLGFKDITQKIYEEIKQLPQSNQYQVKNLIKTLEQRNSDLSEKIERLTNPDKDVSIEELVIKEFRKQLNLQ